jgi:hypothetical protein
MPSASALRGIASGLVETFVSRNNDVSGYWGIGQIQREIGGSPDAFVDLDLLHGKATPDGPIARELVAHYSVYLSASLAREGFSLSGITAAKVLIEFGAFGEVSSPDFSAIGNPFTCKVILANGSGKVLSAVRAGHSWPHNPERELCSKRAQ